MQSETAMYIGFGQASLPLSKGSHILVGRIVDFCLDILMEFRLYDLSDRIPRNSINYLQSFGVFVYGKIVL